MIEENSIGGRVHLGVGQEGIEAGLSHFLTKDDYVFGAQRSHSNMLALGGSVIFSKFYFCNNSVYIFKLSKFLFILNINLYM